jgi:hypothetical protein
MLFGFKSRPEGCSHNLRKVALTVHSLLLDRDLKVAPTAHVPRLVQYEDQGVRIRNHVSAELADEL